MNAKDPARLQNIAVLPAFFSKAADQTPNQVQQKGPACLSTREGIVVVDDQDAIWRARVRRAFTLLYVRREARAEAADEIEFIQERVTGPNECFLHMCRR